MQTICMDKMAAKKSASRFPQRKRLAVTASANGLESAAPVTRKDDKKQTSPVICKELNRNNRQMILHGVAAVRNHPP